MQKSCSCAEKTMDTKQLTDTLLSSIESEVQLWATESQTLHNSYDYESKFSERIQKINNILLQTSVDSLCKEREKKKSKPVMGQ